jgi:hypothetical protein
LVTQIRLKEVLNYDPETGIFIWKIHRGGRAKVGTIAGTSSHGYVMIQIDKQMMLAHRLAWLYMYGYLPKLLDHKNCVKNDNRIENLRLATHSQNKMNIRRKTNNTSGFKGVSLHKATNKWRATIVLDGKQKTIGYFRDKEMAYAGYVKASEQFGEFQRIC